MCRLVVRMNRCQQYKLDHSHCPVEVMVYFERYRIAKRGPTGYGSTPWQPTIYRLELITILIGIEHQVKQSGWNRSRTAVSIMHKRKKDSSVFTTVNAFSHARKQSCASATLPTRLVADFSEGRGLETLWWRGRYSRSVYGA